TLPADARQDPTFYRTKGAEKGRDGCRVPLPWEADAPGFGFSDTFDALAGGAALAPWLPQPSSFAEYAEYRQAGVEGSTLELYRAALRFRRARLLGSGTLQWSDIHDPAGGVLAFLNGPVLVVANMGAEDVVLPGNWAVALA